jgi:lipoate-protein ligase A
MNRLFETLEVWDDPTARTPEGQMALDDALLERIPYRGFPLLRFFFWTAPWVSFGRSQSLEEALTFAGSRPVVRRSTGGGMVEHDGGELTYSLIFARREAAAGLRASLLYQRVHEAIRDLLSAEGVPAVLVEDCHCGRPGQCFNAPSRFDVGDGDRKLAGAAQRRTKEGVLLQGSIRADSDLRGELRQGLPLLLARHAKRCGEEFQEVVPRADQIERERYRDERWLKGGDSRLGSQVSPA